MVSLFDGLADGVGDDFRLIAVDAAGGESPGHGERVEHVIRLARRFYIRGGTSQPISASVLVNRRRQ